MQKITAEKFSTIAVEIIAICFVCLFLAGAIDNAVHYDGFYSGFKISVAVVIAVRYFISYYHNFIKED